MTQPTIAAGPPLRVAMIGHAFMGRAHSHAWRTAPAFFDLPRAPVLAFACGRDGPSTAAAAARQGWAAWSTDWREVIARDDVDLIDICTPGSSHAEIAIAALSAGKHVLCEKPLANSIAEAESMAAAATAAAAVGVRAMVGFNYRRVPAVALARQLVAAGRVGRVRHVRAAYLQDWLVDPELPLSWRLRAEDAGSGALGDIGSHAVDLAEHLLGEPVIEVSGMTARFVDERPTTEGGRGPVTVDDAALGLLRFGSGAVGTLEATRMATGRKNGLRIEVNGELGSVAFDLERINELEVCEPGAGGDGFRRLLVTEAQHPWVAAWWPPGHVLGWEHTFTHQVVDLVHAIHDGVDPTPSFADGLHVQRVLDALLASAADGAWHAVERALG